MALITSAGVGSGLDLESIIAATVGAANQPKVAQFTRVEQENRTQLSALGAVKSALSKLNDVIEKLADPKSFDKRVANITQPESGDLIRVSSNSDATPGDFDIEVIQLAQGSRAISADGTFTSADQVINTTSGTLTLSAGTKTFNVAIDANSTLEDIRQAINSNEDNFGVSVNIINTGGEAKLVIESSAGGSGNDLTVTATSDEFDGLTTTSFAGGAGGMSIAAEDVAQDAIIKIDGITATNTTNVFSDVIQGSTITALKQSENNETANLKIEQDREGNTKLIDEFVAAYNAVIDIMDKATAIGQPLQSDSTIRGLQQQMVNALTTDVVGAGAFETLFDIGISLNKDGKLEKDNLVRSLEEAMDLNFAGVGKIFSSEDGVGAKLEELMGNYIDNDGAITFREKTLNENLRDLTEDRADHQYRMEQLEISLRQKYAGLDVLLAQMQATQAALGQQLANLPGFKTSKD